MMGRLVSRRTVWRVLEVAAVDVDPHAAELRHHLLEAAEVDGDKVVDGQVGQPAHRLESP